MVLYFFGITKSRIFCPPWQNSSWKTAFICTIGWSLKRGTTVKENIWLYLGKGTNYVKSKMYSRAQTWQIFFFLSFCWPFGISFPLASQHQIWVAETVVKGPSARLNTATFYYHFWPSPMHGNPTGVEQKRSRFN